jgi:hypothetical protein
MPEILPIGFAGKVLRSRAGGGVNPEHAWRSLRMTDLAYRVKRLGNAPQGRGPSLPSTLMREFLSASL